MGAKQPARLERQLKGGGVLEGVADAVPDTVCDDVPVGVQLGVPVAVPDTVCDGVRVDVPLSVLERVPDTVCDGVREGVPLSVLVRVGVPLGVLVREGVFEGVRVAVQLGGALNARPATVHADAQAQGWQLAAPAEEKVPMGHSVGVAEEGGQKEPAGHEAHCEALVAPCVSLYLPAAHAVQEVFPAALQLPSAQHVPAAALENKPLPQTLQADAPAPE